MSAGFIETPNATDPRVSRRMLPRDIQTSFTVGVTRFNINALTPGSITIRRPRLTAARRERRRFA